MKPKETTYTSFLDTNQFVSTSPLHERAETLIEHFKPVNLSYSPFAPVVFLVDYSTRRYIYVEDSCFDLLGFTASYFLETGLEEYISRWHKADFQIMNSGVFPTNMSFLRKIPKNEFDDYVFSYNYRFLNAINEYVTVLQRFSYIANPQGAAPLGVVGVIFDITHFKTDLSVVHTIEKITSVNGKKVNELIFKNVYPICEDDHTKLLSTREIEIVTLMARGLSSKQIASHIHLSINTVNNHRKNMLAKTACKTSSELVNYAVKHGFV